LALIADRPRLALALAAVLACLALFGLGVAIAPGAAGDPTPVAPVGQVRPAHAAKALSVGSVRELGTLPALRAPRPKPKPRPGPPPSRSSGSGGGGAATPPPVAPPVAAPIAPPPVAPPPGPPSCIGAGCDYR
jgi:hypothetical protein